MAYEKKEGDIAIFKVKEKKNEKGPDWTGTALIDGVEKQVSLWSKSQTMLAGSIKEKFTPSQQSAPKIKPAPKDEDLEDTIPF